MERSLVGRSQGRRARLTAAVLADRITKPLLIGEGANDPRGNVAPGLAEAAVPR
jgi:hypothetical protein